MAPAASLLGSRALGLFISTPANLLILMILGKASVVLAFAGCPPRLTRAGRKHDSESGKVRSPPVPHLSLGP